MQSFQNGDVASWVAFAINADFKADKYYKSTKVLINWGELVKIHSIIKRNMQKAGLGLVQK